MSLSRTLTASSRSMGMAAIVETAAETVVEIAAEEAAAREAAGVAVEDAGAMVVEEAGGVEARAATVTKFVEISYSQDKCPGFFCCRSAADF